MSQLGGGTLGVCRQHVLVSASWGLALGLLTIGWEKLIDVDRTDKSKGRGGHSQLQYLGEEYMRKNPDNNGYI